MNRDAVALAGPQWLALFAQRTERNTRLASRYRKRLIPVNYDLAVSSLSLDGLDGYEVQIVAPGTPGRYRADLAQALVAHGAALAVWTSDQGSISAVRP